MRHLLILYLFLPFVILAQSDFQKGESLFQQKKYREAETVFKRHLKANPNDLKAKEYLGDISASGHEWDEALVYYRKLLDLEPENASYNFKYGGVLGLKAKEGNKITALALLNDIKTHLQKAVDLDPHHIEARWAMVQLYMELPGVLGGSERLSRKYAEELLRISAVDGHLALGYISVQAKRYNEAEIHYKNAVAVGGSPHTYEKLADLYENMTGEYLKALQTRIACYYKNKKNDQNYEIGRIAALYDVVPETGLTFLHTFLENYSKKDSTPREYAYLRIAQIHKQKKNREEAVKYIRKALALNAQFKEAREEKKEILSL